jgi:hypothetical protein
MTDLTMAQVQELIADGTISGGMIPKVETCMEAVTLGVKGATILDGTVPHALLLELFTEGGIGTMIHKYCDDFGKTALHRREQLVRRGWHRLSLRRKAAGPRYPPDAAVSRECPHVRHHVFRAHL